MKLTLHPWPIIALILLNSFIQSCNKSDSPAQNNPPGGNDTTQTHPTQKKWTSMTALSGPGRERATSFAIGQKFFVGLGDGFTASGDQGDFADFYAYDMPSGKWTQIADFPDGPREFAQGFSVNGKGYIALGQTLGCTPGCVGTNCCNIKLHNDIWEYDDVTDQWTMVATIPGFIPDHQLEGRVFVIGNKAYINYDGKLWAFDPADRSVTPKADAPDQSILTACFSVNNKGYIGTGQNSSSSNLSNSFYEYDPVSDHWTQKADFPGQARRLAVGYSVGGKGYIGWGEVQTPIDVNTIQWTGTNDVWEYSPDTDKWVLAANYPGAKSLYKVAVTIGEKAIVGTGRAYVGPEFFLSEFWIY